MVFAGAAPFAPGVARVTFAVGREPRLVVPTSAIVRRGALDLVFITEADRARLRIVTLGEPDGPWMEVLSGLDAGERVVRTVPRDLRDGARVEVSR